MSEIYENNEIMEEEITLEPEGGEEVETKSRNKNGLAALAIGGGLALVGLTIAGVKKFKKKQADKPQKQKTKLKLVRVPVEECEGIIEAEEAVAEDKEKTE